MGTELPERCRANPWTEIGICRQRSPKGDPMSVRCEECKYENLPQHSFCGMCGAKLPSRRRVEREREEAQAFSRPSLLGLAEDDPTEAERVEYLLEDDSGGEHRRGLLALLLLLAVIAGAGWHWRGEMRAWIAKAGKN